MLQKVKKVIKNFVFGSFKDKKYYLIALKWSMIVRFSMVFLPFKYYRGLFGKLQNVAETNEYSPEKSLEIKRIREIVISICRNTPWESKCLVEAITCKKMLQKIGVETTVYLGIRKDENGKEMKAHAWLKLGDHILTGRSGHQSFKVVNFYS